MVRGSRRWAIVNTAPPTVKIERSSPNPAISKAPTHLELQSTILDGEIARPTASGRNVTCRECCEPRYEPDHAATHALVHSLAEDASS